MTLHADSATAQVEQIAHWASRQRDIFYLSSCGQPDAGNLGHYELIVAQGMRRYLVVNAGSEVDWEQLRRFHRFGSWSFFAVSYDFRTVLATGFRGGQRDVLGWPLLYLVEPEHVITVTRGGELEVFSADPAAIHQQLAAPADADVEGELSISCGEIRSSIGHREYLAKVAHIKEQIARGSFYEINLCVETVLEDMVISRPFSFHQQLLALSPAPFSSYVQLGAMHLMAASPERYLKKAGTRLYTQPIKGTSARHAEPSADEASRRYLANSVKERAEHIMIVDLMRNDLGRLCATGTVAVPELCSIYGYRQVYQMVSTIAGECRPGVDFFDALRMTFPMGSMTGAPKHCVMQYIEQLEPAARGWYSGSVGYMAPNGDFDSNVVIRGLLYDAKLNRAKYAVGGAITYDSDPEAEYRECLLKSRAIRSLLESRLSPMARYVA